MEEGGQLNVSWSWRNAVRSSSFVDFLFTTWYVVSNGFILFRILPIYTPGGVSWMWGLANNLTDMDTAMEPMTHTVLTFVLLKWILVVFGFCIAIAAVHVKAAVRLFHLTTISPEPERYPLKDLLAWLRCWWIVIMLAAGLFPLMSTVLLKISLDLIYILLPITIIYLVFRGLWAFSVWKFMGELKSSAVADVAVNASDETGKENSQAHQETNV